MVNLRDKLLPLRPRATGARATISSTPSAEVSPG